MKSLPTDHEATQGGFIFSLVAFALLLSDSIPATVAGVRWMSDRIRYIPSFDFRSFSNPEVFSNTCVS
jgi:hypothetical protein